MINYFVLALAQGLEFIAVLLQLPSVLVADLSQVFYNLAGVNNLNSGDGNEEQ